MRCAGDAFQAQGLPGTGLLDIASRAGIAKAHVYNFFRSKDQLYLAVYLRAHLGQSDAQPLQQLQQMPRSAQWQALAHYLLDSALGPGRNRRLPLDLCERALSDPHLLEDLLHAGAEVHSRMDQVLSAAGLLVEEDMALRQAVLVLITCLVACIPVASSLERALLRPELLAEVLRRLLSPSAPR